MTDDFKTTRWSVVIAAGRREDSAADDALAVLCETYWYPLYAYARRRGDDPDGAADLTQAFFADLLGKRWLEVADPGQGRFRAFLLTVFKRFRGHERERERAAKRGGGKVPISIDAAEGERRYAHEPGHDITPERIFERRWAMTLLSTVLDQVRREMETAGRGRLFEALRSRLLGGSGDESYAEVADRLEMTEVAVKVAAHRLRSRYRDRLRSVVADTVSGPAEIDEEIRYLIEALSIEPRIRAT